MASVAEGETRPDPTHVDISEAQQYLAHLIDRAEAGEDVVIDREGKPSVRLTPVAPDRSRAPRELGRAAGQVWISDDFDDPVPGFEEFYE